MEPITVLVSALGLGAQVLSPLADQALKDGYAGLKALIIRKFGASDPALAPVLEKHAKSPGAWKAPTTELLQETGVDRDQEILDQATELLKLAEKHQPGVTGGLVGQINAQGGIVTVLRDNPGTINIGRPS
jgi:hypothetical protein